MSGGWELDRALFALFVQGWRREKLKLSLREAAPLAGLSYSVLQRAEQGVPVSAGHMLRLCLLMDANPFWFLTDPATGRRIATPPDCGVPRETSTETAGVAG